MRDSYFSYLEVHTHRNQYPCQLKLNKFIQKAIIEFDKCGMVHCPSSDDQCHKCVYQEICWTYLDIEYLNLRFFK